MLVLTRKVGESILIDQNIRISVQSVRGSRVKLAIDAPDEVAVLRGELIFDGSTKNAVKSFDARANAATQRGGQDTPLRVLATTVGSSQDNAMAH